MALLIGDRVQLRDLCAIEGERLQLLRRCAEVLPQAAVVFNQLRVLQNQVLAHEPLERRRLLVELAAGAARLRGLQHRLLALRAQSVEADDQFNERIEQRQADQQESEQDELEE